ncbi:PIN domain-containing protein [Roseiflexus sp. RS-1]|jgi:predicted nucleic acid-binding protein|uniref:PIN domain-containing protein n=1 Tax=Roseiflexus sp. (strain RS-1) TaxID=357808 RepID=UPI0000D7FF98|nr:PIN domain-containing protein [Roseiflexus sp. RS-1]ABQ91409.1 PilT protein domain protein [Roseiflexus sp. RS-1]MBO9320811.1 PIN domain-containing protein [Roseiflexus sp.]
MGAASAGSALAFIDTNIWLYAFSTSQEKLKSQRAKGLIRGTPQIALSTQVVNEVSVNMLRKFQADEQAIRKLIRSLYRKYLIVELNRSILLHASDLRSAYHVSYWDSLIIASALAVGATTLYTEDLQDGLIINSQLTIVNPMKAVIQS